MTIGDLTIGPQLSDTVQTTDANANVLLIEVPVPDNNIGICSLHITGDHLEDNIVIDTLEGFTRDGAAAVYEGQIKEDRFDNGSAAWDYTVDDAGTAGTLRVRVTGEAAHTINWHCIATFPGCFEAFA